MRHNFLLNNCLAFLASILFFQKVFAVNVTYQSFVKPMLAQNCTGCHQQGGVAPFSLTTFEQVKTRAASILDACKTHRMPHGVTARPECSPPGTFVGPSRLSAKQLNMLETWINHGKPEGLPFQAGKTESQESDIDLGEPDVIIPISNSGFNIPASGDGTNIIRNFPISVPFKVDQFVTAVKIITDGGNENSKQGSGQIIHHAHLFYDENAVSTKLLANFHKEHPEDNQPGFEGDQGLPKVVLGPWFPGGDGVTKYTDGVGARLKAGSNIVLQVHYALHNKNSFIDRTKVGLWFARKPIQKERKSIIVKNENFIIPAGQVGTVSASKQLEKSVVLYSMLPHMHQYGKRYTVTAVHPDGQRECLVDVDWDFNHQNQFVYRTPKTLEAGTWLELNALYDNRESNPNQLFSPPIDITWGESSLKEMMLTMFAFSEEGSIVTPVIPVIENVFVDSATGELVVRGKNLQEGAFIELAGKFVIDPHFLKQRSGIAEVRTKKWKAVLEKAKHNGRSQQVFVVNPAGGRSNNLVLSL